MLALSAVLADNLKASYHRAMQFGVRLVFFCAVLAVGAEAAAGSCQRADFEAVVDEAASVLRNLNAANKPKFQDKLRQLKAMRGWSQEQFLKEAAPLVADDTIQGYDRISASLLEVIASGGQTGASAATPDCTMLDGLRVSMSSLVEAQTAKWGYMNARIDAELAK